MVLVLNERKKADFIDEKTIMDLLEKGKNHCREEILDTSRRTPTARSACRTACRLLSGWDTANTISNPLMRKCR